MGWLLRISLCAGVVGPCLAQESLKVEQDKTPDPAAKAIVAKKLSVPGIIADGKVGPLQIGGLFDSYYSYDANHPYTARNNLRNFDIGADSFDVNMAKFSVEMAPGPVGFRLDAGSGRAFDAIHVWSNTEPSFFRHIWQSYVSFKPRQLKGFEADFGKFFTSVGAEVTDTNLNWNYSRSWLFTNGPYFHFGLRTSMPIGKYFTGGVQVLQGWNNISDNNGGKTWGFTANVTGSKVSWANTYLVGPEKNGTTEGNRHFFDTVLKFTPAGKFAYYLNFDYGLERNPNARSQKFLGIAAAGHYQATKRIAFAPRLEWYNDVDGFVTGRAQQLKEITLTGEYAWFQGVLTRLEYRHDWSNQPFFDRGAQLGSAKHQDTVAIALLAFFPPTH